MNAILPHELWATRRCRRRIRPTFEQLGCPSVDGMDAASPGSSRDAGGRSLMTDFLVATASGVLAALLVAGIMARRESVEPWHRPRRRR